MLLLGQMGNRQSTGRVTKGYLLLTPVRDPPGFVVAAVKTV